MRENVILGWLLSEEDLTNHQDLNPRLSSCQPLKDWVTGFGSSYLLPVVIESRKRALPDKSPQKKKGRGKYRKWPWALLMLESGCYTISSFSWRWRRFSQGKGERCDLALLFSQSLLTGWRCGANAAGLIGSKEPLAAATSHWWVSKRKHCPLLCLRAETQKIDWLCVLTTMWIHTRQTSQLAWRCCVCCIHTLSTPVSQNTDDVVVKLVLSNKYTHVS